MPNIKSRVKPVFAGYYCGSRVAQSELINIFQKQDLVHVTG